MTEEMIVGRNSVREAIKSGRPINKLLMARGEKHGSIIEIINLARQKGLMVQEIDPAKLDSLSGGLRHQGIAALVSPVPYADIETILASAYQKQEAPFIVLLDELEDPHNVGAILRTADAAGVHGVLLPQRRSCPLSATVAKTSAGAVEYVPVARIGNVTQTIDKLKKHGIWVVGADADGDKNYFDIDFTDPVLIVVGNEGKGLGRLVKQQCDYLVRIPMRGRISSLNASVACSLLLYEVLRQRDGKKNNP
ncbi:MAG: methyltransferase, TrmH family, group 3 [Firmicutes bacterium]|nr:methyltransferase, TrmH family, group 3 [Bacillota bacterium]